MNICLYMHTKFWIPEKCTSGIKSEVSEVTLYHFSLNGDIYFHIIKKGKTQISSIFTEQSEQTRDDQLLIRICNDRNIDCYVNINKLVQLWDFPGGTVVENLPANAGGHRFNPWSRKIPHATEELSPCTTTTEPAL